MTQVEWRGKEDFANFSDALDVRPEDIMAVSVHPAGVEGLYVVLYTLGDDTSDDAWIYRAIVTENHPEVPVVVLSTSKLAQLGAFKTKVEEFMQRMEQTGK